jgi:hypothetical protein
LEELVPENLAPGSATSVQETATEIQIVPEIYDACNAIILGCMLFLAAHGPRALMTSSMTIMTFAFYPPAYQFCCLCYLRNV